MNNLGGFMRDYWKGYRFAKSVYLDCGFEELRSEWNYGLAGCSVAFCKGFKRFADCIVEKRNAGRR